MRKKNIYIIALLITALSSFMLTSCDVHEWPELPDEVPFQFHLKFETDMPIEHNKYGTRAGKNEAELEMRYIVRAYPILQDGKTAQEYIDEYIFTRNISENYDCSFTYNLPPGEYTIRVWADFVKQGSKDNYLYDADNFREIYLIENDTHPANTDNRDAFRGSKDITLVADIVERNPDETTIEMLRPMGKFEFITTDLLEFVNNEARNIAAKSNQNTVNTASVDLDDYRVVFFYVGFMPNAYSLITDKPVDSATGVFFSSKLTQISQSDASMGFDYVFVNGQESVTTVVIGIFNRAGEQLGMTAPIDVPIKRGIHTIIEGKFLLEDNKGGVNINPDFDGDFNLTFP